MNTFDVALQATVPAGAWLTTYSEIETMRTVAGPHPHSVWEPETTRVELIRDSNQAPWRYEGPAAVVIGELAEEVEPTIVETPDGRARLTAIIMAKHRAIFSVAEVFSGTFQHTTELSTDRDGTLHLQVKLVGRLR